MKRLYAFLLAVCASLAVLTPHAPAQDEDATTTQPAASTQPPEWQVRSYVASVDAWENIGEYEKAIADLKTMYDELPAMEESNRARATMEYRARLQYRILKGLVEVSAQQKAVLSELKAIHTAIKDGGGGLPSVPDQDYGPTIDPNTATLSELDTLDEVGESTAQKIIGYRESVDPPAFVEPMDMTEVRGVSSDMVNLWLQRGRIEIASDSTSTQ